jgi:Cu(I)/Ag(I) efflux system membrane fusion protein
MKTILVIILTLAIAVPATWFVTRKMKSESGNQKPSGRKVLYYQSAMHPWIKSDKPERCTICGMELTPVYEGEKGFEMEGDVVSLNQGMIQVLKVETSSTKKRPLTRKLEVAGQIEDDATRHRVISAYVDGRIEKLFVNFIGAEVTQGQTLAEIYSPILLQAEREYRQLSGELKTNTGIRLKQMGLSPGQIQELDKKPADQLTTQILAPMTGTVVVRNVYEGQYVKEGEALFEIADFSTMWFLFNAYEQDIPWIKTGQKVDISTPSHPGQIFKGTISFIDPNFDEATRSTKVRVELPNPQTQDHGRMLHRLYADGIVHVGLPEVLTVPRSAVIQTGPEAVVYLDQGGGAYARQVVKLGRRGDEYIEIIEGLKDGDAVVTNGNLLIDGQAEMNRSFAQPQPPSTNSPAPILTETHKKALSEFVLVADKIAAALASENIAEFNDSRDSAMKAADLIIESFKDRPELSKLLEDLQKSKHLHEAKTIAEARKEFLGFTLAGAAALQPLRKSQGVPAFEVWECPMVNRAIEGAPKKGQWIQAAGREIQNPFFGAEMLDCGNKVKP